MSNALKDFLANIIIGAVGLVIVVIFAALFAEAIGFVAHDMTVLFGVTLWGVLVTIMVIVTIIGSVLAWRWPHSTWRTRITRALTLYRS